MGDKPRISATGWLTIAIAVAVIAPLGWYGYRIITWEGIWPEEEPRPFDSVEWKAWTKEDMQSRDVRRCFARKDMFDDLIAKHEFKGWTTDQLKALLGEPNTDFLPKDWDIAYLVGPDWVDYEILVFRLDENQRVKDYSVLML